jgi:Replication protein
VPAGRDYPNWLKKLHQAVTMDAKGIPGLAPGVYVGRMENCAGFKSGCGSPYCPACSRRMFYALQKRLMSVAQRIPAHDLRFATFTVADCSDMELRPNLKFITECARTMLKGIAALRGWFIRKEVSRSINPGYYHPHLHVLLHVAPGYTSGRNTMSLAKWGEAWMRAIPEELQVQGRPDYDSFMCKGCPTLKASSSTSRRVRGTKPAEQRSRRALTVRLRSMHFSSQSLV